MAPLLTDEQSSEAAIFARVWEGRTGGLTPAVAKHVLELGFSPEDKARMRDLVERNREGRLTDGEREELDNFVKVGDLLAVLQSKARQLLKVAPPARNRDD
jgi:hypothetical protein